MVTVGTCTTTLSAQNLQRVVNLMFDFGSLPTKPTSQSSW